MKLKLFYDGQSVTVTSEAAAKTWARKQLGAKRLKEAPTSNGWQYFNATDKDDMSDDSVNVVVIG
jgi:hypothetical protein